MLRTDKPVAMPQEGIISAIQVGEILAYFTKQMKSQELRDLIQQLEVRGIQVLNCLAMEQEDTGVNR